MLKSYLLQLLDKRTLSAQEAEAAMRIILTDADTAQTAAFLAILKYRGETVDEIVGMVRALEDHAIAVKLPCPTLDIVGTGGDLAHTVNISTGSAILAAACGVPIAKHGNRSVSSRSGSADVLEAMGLKLELSPELLSQCLVETNIAFMYAPYYHPALKKLGQIRRALKFPTLFNLLGPLLNPAKAEYALIGVSQESFVELTAKVLVKLGHIKRALVFHGCGLDELTPLGPLKAYDIYEGQIKSFEIDPVALGFATCSLEDLQGGDAELNAAILNEVFTGRPSAVADALAFNAGAGLWIYGRAGTLEEGIQMAKEALAQGAALKVLEKWKHFNSTLTS